MEPLAKSYAATIVDKKAESSLSLAMSTPASSAASATDLYIAPVLI